MTRGTAVRLAVGVLACLAGMAWTLARLLYGEPFAAALRFIVTCVACEVILPGRRAGPE
jgi:hypothetical protein